MKYKGIVERFFKLSVGWVAIAFFALVGVFIKHGWSGISSLHLWAAIGCGFFLFTFEFYLTRFRKNDPYRFSLRQWRFFPDPYENFASLNRAITSQGYSLVDGSNLQEGLIYVKSLSKHYPGRYGNKAEIVFKVMLAGEPNHRRLSLEAYSRPTFRGNLVYAEIETIIHESGTEKTVSYE